MISVLQERAADTSANSPFSLAFSNPVTPGSSIHVIVRCSTSGGAASFTVSDSVNGSYGAALASPISLNGLHAHFRFDNTAAGTPNVTMTPNIVSGFNGICIREIGGTSGYDVQASQSQSGPGTGTDAVSTGNATPSVQPGLISALLLDTSANSAITQGTGFTLGLSGIWLTASGAGITEQQRYTSLAAAAATGTAAVGSHAFVNLAAFFKETAAGASPILMGQACLILAIITANTMLLELWHGAFSWF